MKIVHVCVMGLALAMGAASARATLDLYEDFEAYAVDTSINGLGDDGGYPRWAAQANRKEIYDSDHAYVRNVDGGQVLELVNRGHTGDIDTVYASMAFGSKVITGQGTVYMQFKADGPNDTIVGLNGLASGYFGADANTDGQGTGNWSAQAPLWRMSGGEMFRARASDAGDEFVDMGQQADVWQEIWIQIDVTNQRTKYYLCAEGGEPQAAINPVTGDEWWAHWSEYDYIFNIKFLVGMYPWPDANIETAVLLDNIAIDDSGFSLNGVGDGTFTGHDVVALLPGDANGDGAVNIDDFVALKNGFGTGSTWAEGDFNGDGAVNIDDFVILKNHFGASAVPEPATMSLLTVGGVGLIRRRRR